MSPKKFTVTELTDLIKRQLENTFSGVLVEGEISNCKMSSLGHLYWTLKDTGAVISGVIFKGSLRYLDFQPKDGMFVRVTGRISVYAPRGAYQLVAEAMEAAGTGDILAMLERRKKMFALEGLFDEAHKKPIPRFPEKLAIITSHTGAALRDILNILKRRAAGLDVVILPTPVQGEDAAEFIAARIRQVNQWKLADVIICGRGGGSLEDLLPFSDDCVVRAVAASAIPVISAVGHETDMSLQDFAADLRAPTPSAAAELVSENYADTLNAVRSFSAQMHRTISGRLERAALLIKPFKTDYLERAFRSILQPRLIRLDDAKENLLYGLKEKITDMRSRYNIAKATLESCDPAKIMQRGFSVVVNTRTGKVLRKPRDTKKGDVLAIRLLEGSVTAKTQ
ncbi:MAG: exodeoxyribonuclease VII large subunit [Termitinemataceae bacterium]|nr:MAG: exodeoxyribonuclease VII large subunit [Termitinemataceae bacterium]